MNMENETPLNGFVRTSALNVNTDTSTLESNANNRLPGGRQGLINDRRTYEVGDRNEEPRRESNTNLQYNVTNNEGRQRRR